jgi:hypothetical protein
VNLPFFSLLLAAFQLFSMAEGIHSNKDVPVGVAMVEVATPMGEKSSVQESSSANDDSETENETSSHVDAPLKFKILSILLVSAIGFGSSWSSGITGAMKTTLKKASFVRL